MRLRNPDENPHPSHELGEKYSTIGSPGSKSRFYTASQCVLCGATMLSGVAGNWIEDDLVRECVPALLESRIVTESGAAINEPPPTDGREDVYPLVLADILARVEMGRTKYGGVLRAHNGRDALMDAYQEALDLVLYLRQAIMERET